jgi:hypothetical protein
VLTDDGCLHISKSGYAHHAFGTFHEPEVANLVQAAHIATWISGRQYLLQYCTFFARIETLARSSIVYLGLTIPRASRRMRRIFSPDHHNAPRSSCNLAPPRTTSHAVDRLVVYQPRRCARAQCAGQDHAPYLQARVPDGCISWHGSCMRAEGQAGMANTLRRSTESPHIR